MTKSKVIMRSVFVTAVSQDTFLSTLDSEISNRKPITNMVISGTQLWLRKPHSSPA